MKSSESFTKSAYLMGSSNGKPKLTNYTCLFIRRLLKFGGLQLFYTRSPSYILHFCLARGKSHFTIFKPMFFSEKFGFSTSSVIRVTGSERERGIINRDNLNNFYEWFCGFTDAEGSFYIVTGKRCAFRFQINLHKQDIDALYYIHKSLGFGEVRSYNNFASYTVTKLKDIVQLIEIFSHHPLRGSKWLNYLDFSKAYALYTEPNKRGETLKEILKIKQGMNRLRLDHTMPKDNNTNITPYWLLGFVEGEGCFSINRGNNYRLDFSMAQAYSNLELIKKIKVYLEDLPNTYGNYAGAIGISSVVSNNPNQQSVIRIETARIPFITNIFIPFLDSLNWRSKKQLDFKDWKNILMLKEQGHHLSEKGAKVIDLILSQMNSNRLSTSSNQPIADRAQVLDEVNQLLSGPSNFELKNGRIWVVSLNQYYNSSRKSICVGIVDEKGNNLHSFDSLADCANFLNVKATTVSKRIIKGISFLFDNKKVSIKKLSSS